MKKHIRCETNVEFQQRLGKHFELDVLDANEVNKTMSVAKQVVAEQSTDDQKFLKIWACGQPPLQSLEPMEQFCTVTPTEDPKPEMSRNALVNSGVETGLLEHTELRVKAARDAAHYPIVASLSATSDSTDASGSEVEVDPDPDQRDMRLDRSSFRYHRAGRIPQDLPRVKRHAIKRIRDATEDERAAKRRRSSSSSLEVNVASRTPSEERQAYEPAKVYKEEASEKSMHGIGGWTSPEPDA